MMKQSYTNPDPVFPGSFIQEDIVGAYGMTQDELAKRLGVTRQTVNELINGRRGVTADMALRLGKLTGTTPEFWLNLQRAIDLKKSRETLHEKLEMVKPLDAA